MIPSRIHPTTRAHARGERPGRTPARAPGSFLLATSLLLLLPPPGFTPLGALGAEAQARERPPPARPVQSGDTTSPQLRQQMMVRIQRDLEARMARELELTQQQQAGLRSVLREFGGERGELMRERFLLRQAMETHRRGDGSEADARRLLDRARALRAREVDLQRREEERLLQILSPTQLLGFHELMAEFNESVRRLEMQRGRPGPGVPPTPRAGPENRTGGGPR